MKKPSMELHARRFIQAVEKNLPETECPVTDTKKFQLCTSVLRKILKPETK